MYLDTERTFKDLMRKVRSKKGGKKVKPDDRFLCLTSSTEGTEMELLLKIAEIIKSGKKEVFIIGEEPGETALNQPGLFSLTIGFR